MADEEKRPNGDGVATKLSNDTTLRSEEPAGVHGEDSGSLDEAKSNSAAEVNGAHLDTSAGLNVASTNNGGTDNSDKINSKSDSTVNGVSKKATVVAVTNGEGGVEQNPASGTSINDQDGADLGDDDGNAISHMDMGVGTKKKKRKPKSKRGLNAPSGFEEYYVDAPLTPAEFEQEKQIYDPSYRFTQRIETAIQRFCAKRRLETEPKKLFDRYFAHGGIDTGPKMFGGGIDLTKDAAQIAELAATHYVNNDKVADFDSVHVVDFEGCLRSFLSGLRDDFDLSSEEKLTKLIGIIRNFLNYLLHHNVCPEYNDQIYAARSICDKAVKELWNIEVMIPLLPGDFNMACSEILGGTYQGMYSKDHSWNEDVGMETSIGIDPKQARNAFKMGIAANASEEMFSKYEQQLRNKECRVIDSEEVNLEVTDIIHAGEDVSNLYGQEQSVGLKTLGKIKAKTWVDPRALDEDLTEEEEAYLNEHPPQSREYEFWIEEDILEKFVIGMKFAATVKETSFGLMYLDTVTGVQCSFFQTIPNELMGDWKETEKEWLPMKYNKYTAAKKKEEEKESDTPGQEDEGATADETEAKNDTKATNQWNDEHRPENEPDNFEVNKNLIAAGYDEDLGETPEPGAEAAKEDADLDGTAGEEFGIEVQRAGVELLEVSANADPVVQETFNVNRIEEVD